LGLMRLKTTNRLLMITRREWRALTPIRSFAAACPRPSLAPGRGRWLLRVFDPPRARVNGAPAFAEVLMSLRMKGLDCPRSRGARGRSSNSSSGILLIKRTANSQGAIAGVPQNIEAARPVTHAIVPSIDGRVRRRAAPTHVQTIAWPRRSAAAFNLAVPLKSVLRSPVRNRPVPARLPWP